MQNTARKKNFQCYLDTLTSRTIKSKAAFEGLNTSELAEKMILHCLGDEALFNRLVSECHAAKQQKQAA